MMDYLTDQDLSNHDRTSQFHKRWGWYSAVYELAKGSITEFENITREKLTKALTVLLYVKEKSEVERAELKANGRKSSN